jgi:pyruvate,water dikinase
MGLTNVKVMIPFVRTVDEAQSAVDVLKTHGIERGENGLELYMMVELPSNVLLIDRFAPYFDGFSIGSNDLTQLVLGVDRDSSVLRDVFDERDPAVKKCFELTIQGAHAKHIPVGICGQAPSDYPEIADFLIEQGIDSLSLNLDSIMPFIMRYTSNSDNDSSKQ